MTNDEIQTYIEIECCSMSVESRCAYKLFLRGVKSYDVNVITGLSDVIRNKIVNTLRDLERKHGNKTGCN